MAWLAVNEYGAEKMFHERPERQRAYKAGFDYWEDRETYYEIRGYTTSAHDYSISLPNGTIEKIIGKKMTWADEPVEI